MLYIEQPSPLDGIASAAAIILILEVGIVILLVAVLMVLLAFGINWLYKHTIPPVRTTIPRVKDALNVVDRSTGRVIDLVAEVYGHRQAVESGISTFFDNLIATDPEDVRATDDTLPTTDKPTPLRD